MREFLALLAGLLPVFVLIGLLWLSLKHRERIYKLPLTRRLLRPPGESLRKEVDDLDDQLVNKFLFAVAGCALLGIGAWAAFRTLFFGAVFAVAGVAVIYFCAASVWRIGSRMRDCRLGFLGERAVGEELSQLLASGWRVFHDVEFNENPGAKPFNIDHVVVGTGGVFAIETKTRRKLVNRKATDSRNEVIFNGSTLAYPWGEETFGIDQARQRANYLARWLKSKLEQEIRVQPVLALPGWSVRRGAKSDLRVISGREIAALFRGEHKRPALTPESARAVAALLDQKCRDVE
jgi:hypothetical protein